MIVINQVCKSYGRYPALEDICCEIPDGTIYGIVGYNGAGKTTLLRIIGGVYRPEQGEVRLDTCPVYENEENKLKLFMMGEELFFLPQATLQMMRWFYKGYYPGWNNRTFDKLLTILDLPDEEKINRFSKGMQRQAGFILALSAASKYLLLDEAFDGLDLSKRRLMEKLLKRYVREKDATVVITSHNLRELESFVDQVGMIRDRKLQISLPVKRMREKYHRVSFTSAEPGCVLGLQALAAQKVAQDGNRYTCWLEGERDTLYNKLEQMGASYVLLQPLGLEEIFLSGEEQDIDDIEDLF